MPTEQPTKAADTSSILTSLGPSAPGFYLPMTGYEFELNHGGNRLELHRQKQWAQTQLFSCNENNRFKHTQTTACIVAVNGCIIGPYRAESLRCFGTNPEIAGLRVTMTVYEGDTSDEIRPSNTQGNDGNKDTETTAMPVFRHATLVLRHQIIVAHPARNHHYHQQRQEFPPYMLPPSSSTTSISSLMTSLSRLPDGDNASASSASNRTRTNTGQSTASSSIGGGTASTAASTTHRYSISSTISGASSAAMLLPLSTSHQQGRRYLFATTTIPLHAGIAARPGYRPVEASAAAERIRQWGGQPDKGVFGNSWLVHMAVEPGHVQHDVDMKMMEQVQRLTGHRSGGGGSGCGGVGGGSTDAPTGGATAVQAMRMVNDHMVKLVAREGTLSVMLSNHVTQKRIARQCPDLVAMWVMAQENL